MTSWKQSWREKANPLRYITKYNDSFTKSMIKLLNIAKFNTSKTGMKIRVLTELIELISHLFNIKKKSPESNKCMDCDRIESLNHYPLKCRKYDLQRKKWIAKLIKINHKYGYKKFRTIKYIVFQYKLYNNTIMIQQQGQIWNEILSYIKSTDRFSNLFAINNKELSA